MIGTRFKHTSAPAPARHVAAPGRARTLDSLPACQLPPLACLPTAHAEQTRRHPGPRPLSSAHLAADCRSNPPAHEVMATHAIHEAMRAHTRTCGQRTYRFYCVVVARAFSTVLALAVFRNRHCSKM
eukprot:1154393-Pelagomonas_calceolata.AAC.2